MSKQPAGGVSPQGWRWKTAAAFAVLVLEIACGGRNEPAGGTTPVSSPPPAPGLGSISGSYVHPPQHNRVIIFVNGVFGDGASTWTNDTTGKYWPTLMASDPDFADADIYVHSFLSPHLTTAQQILELAGRMKDYLETQGVISKHGELVFLCHSMGGLVTRAFLLSARLPAARVPMIYFFATPTAGANVAGIAAHLSDNPQLKDMEPLEEGGYVKDLREQWLQTANEPALDYPNKIASFCSYELKDTYGFRIVPELSATYLCNHETRAVVENHLGIVKPSDVNADPYVFFKAAYQRQFGAEAAPIRSALALHAVGPITLEARELNLGQFRAADVILRPVKATSQSIDVGCGEEKKGTLDAKVDLATGETVSQVRAVIANSSNVKASSAAVVRQSNGSATVGYSIRGLDKVGPDCPGGGHADVVVDFVITRAPLVRPGLNVPVKTLEPLRPIRELVARTPARPG